MCCHRSSSLAECASLSTRAHRSSEPLSQCEGSGTGMGSSNPWAPASGDRPPVKKCYSPSTRSQVVFVAGRVSKQPGALVVPPGLGAHQAAPMVTRDAPHHPPQPPHRPPGDLQDLPHPHPDPTGAPSLPGRLTCSPHGAALQSLNVEVGFRQPPRLQRPPGQL